MIYRVKTSYYTLHEPHSPEKSRKMTSFTIKKEKNAEMLVERKKVFQIKI